MATAFPQALGMAASFDLDYAYRVGRAVATEVRANYNSLHNTTNQGLNCWSPVVNICRDPRWGRCQETYGEDPVLSARFAKYYVTGLQQGPDPNHPEVLASCKHFDAHGGPEGLAGTQTRFGFNCTLSERDWRETYLPAFQACVEAGVGGIMCSYTAHTITGTDVVDVPSCADPLFLQQTLREDWGFDGWVVGDCGALKFIYSAQHYAKTEEEAAVKAINAGVDLECDCCGFGPVFPTLFNATNQSLVSVSRIDKALYRVFTSRALLGALDPFGINPYDALSKEDDVDTAAHRKLAREGAAKVAVLLKNDGPLLPLSLLSTAREKPFPEIKRLCVFGFSANDTSVLMGDYSASPSRAVTIVEGLQSYAPNLLYVQACADIRCPAFNQSEVVAAAKQCDASIVVLGLSAQDACGQCDATNAIEGECCDRAALALPGRQEALLKTVYSVSAERTILLLMNGGAVSSPWAQQHVPAILQAVYPGEEAGNGLADVIFGAVSPSGRLPVTYYYSETDIPPITDYSVLNRTYRFFPGTPLYPFGFGLSYTTFGYSDLTQSAFELEPCRPLQLVAQVSNVGDVASDEVVQLYMSTFNASVPVPTRQLLDFVRFPLLPGDTHAVLFVITPEQMNVMRDGDFEKVIEPGARSFFIGGGQPGTGAPGVEGKFFVVGEPTALSLCPRA